MRDRLLALVVLTSTLPVFAADGPPLPLGSEFRVNSDTAGTQYRSAVATNEAGGFVVAWLDSRVEGQLYDATGTPVGGELVLSPLFAQSGPDVGFDGAGQFVTVWARTVGDPDIFAARFDAAGSAIGGEVPVNNVTSGSQFGPSVAVNTDGSFVVVWTSAGGDGSGYGVRARRFASTGAPDGGEFPVNTYTTGDQRYPSVSSDATGNFIVVWESAGQDGSGLGVYAQRFDPSGATAGGEFRANNTTAGDQRVGAIRGHAAAFDSAGNFLVTWTSAGQDGDGDGKFAHHYDATGAPTGAEFQVNAWTTGNQSAGAVATDVSGGFVVVWTDSTQDGSSSGIFGRAIDAAGVAHGSDFPVNTTTAGAQSDPTVAAGKGGTVVAKWHQNDGASLGVFAQRFAVPLLLGGGGLRLKNKVPDEPVKNKGTLVVRSATIVAGAEGSGGDPTISGGSIRFTSPISGHDSGPLPLPAANWSPKGAPGDVRGWRYKDREQDDGPCKVVVIKTAGRIKARCSGKGVPFPYDLTVGSDEGDVGALLATGTSIYCLQFTPKVGGSGPKNGSDGKLYLAKQSAPPAQCLISP